MSLGRLEYRARLASMLRYAQSHLCRTGGPGRALKIERVKRPVFGPLEKGDIVRHATWGDGEVVRVVGDSVYTFFPVHAEKLLKTSFLEKIEN